MVPGVFTRRMEHLVKSLGIEGMSADQVSVMAKELDDHVSWFRSQSLYEDIRFDGKDSFAARLKTIWLQPTKETVLQVARMVIDEYRDRFPQAITISEEGLENALQYLSYSSFDHRKISSTNILERLNREIRRRSRVVGIFPGMDSYIRLITSYLIEYSEDWSVGKCYIKPSLIEEQRESLQRVA